VRRKGGRQPPAAASGHEARAGTHPAQRDGGQRRAGDDRRQHEGQLGQRMEPLGQRTGGGTGSAINPSAAGRVRGSGNPGARAGWLPRPTGIHAIARDLASRLSGWWKRARKRSGQRPQHQEDDQVRWPSCPSGRRKVPLGDVGAQRSPARRSAPWPTMASRNRLPIHAAEDVGGDRRRDDGRRHSRDQPGQEWLFHHHVPAQPARPKIAGQRGR